MIKNLFKTIIKNIFKKLNLLKPIPDSDKLYTKWIVKYIYESHYKENIKNNPTKNLFIYKTFDNYWEDFWKIISNKELKFALNKYQDMSNLLIPSHQERENLYSYYKSLEYVFIFRYFQYPLFNSDYLKNNIIPLVDFIQKTNEKIKYLEIGPGLPHKLFYLAYKRPDLAKKIDSIEFIDLDTIYFDIVCKITKRLFPNATLINNFSNFQKIISPKDSFNYLHAKDIFEHIYDPKDNLSSILNKAEAKTRIIVDIRDRPPEKYQHVSLKLSSLEKIIMNKGFIELDIKSFSNYLYKNKMRMFDR